MIKTRGSPTDSQNCAVSAIVGSWKDAARLDFQMHIARRFQMADWARTFSSTEIGPFSGPWLLSTWRRHLCSQLCCSWGIQLTRSLLNILAVFGLLTSPSIFSATSNINKWVFREKDWRLSYQLHWANDAVWYVPFFRVPLSDLWFILLFQATYLRHVSGF